MNRFKHDARRLGLAMLGVAAAILANGFTETILFSAPSVMWYGLALVGMVLRTDLDAVEEDAPSEHRHRTVGGGFRRHAAPLPVRRSFPIRLKWPRS